MTTPAEPLSAAKKLSERLAELNIKAEYAVEIQALEQRAGRLEKVLRYARARIHTSLCSQNPVGSDGQRPCVKECSDAWDAANPDAALSPSAAEGESDKKGSAVVGSPQPDSSGGTSAAEPASPAPDAKPTHEALAEASVAHVDGLYWSCGVVGLEHHHASEPAARGCALRRIRAKPVASPPAKPEGALEQAIEHVETSYVPEGFRAESLRLLRTAAAEREGLEAENVALKRSKDEEVAKFRAAYQKALDGAEAENERVTKERDAAIARAEKAERERDEARESAEAIAGDEEAARIEVERERDALRAQLAAAQRPLPAQMEELRGKLEHILKVAQCGPGIHALLVDALRAVTVAHDDQQGGKLDAVAAFREARASIPEGEKAAVRAAHPEVFDPVERPRGYNSHPSGVECITVTEHMGFCVGNAIKYLWRAGEKPGTDPVEDLKKARWYVDREIARRSKAAERKENAT